MYTLSHKFTFHYVSIKSSTGGHYHSQEQKFTFHYVSIKSVKSAVADYKQENLHSTMYLLNHKPPDKTVAVNTIYIPLCIY